jgi:PBP1b-binding outer membrane lipoprotein LpoB
MTTYPRVTSAIATAIILAACSATPANVKPKAEASGAVAQNPACLSQTGSRIAGHNANCSAIGRSYSSDDINRTGSTTAGEALRLLDPSITVHQ